MDKMSPIRASMPTWSTLNPIEQSHSVQSAGSISVLTYCGPAWSPPPKDGDADDDDDDDVM